jgi:sugar phosphate permease
VRSAWSCLLTFVAGVLLDKISTRILMFCSIVVAAIANFMRGIVLISAHLRHHV